MTCGTRVKVRPPIVARIVDRYMTLAHRAAQRDGQVSRTFLEVANLVAPPSNLFHPIERLMRAAG